MRRRIPTSRLPPKPRLVDPRSRRGFQPALLPKVLCVFAPPSPGHRRGRQARIQREFEAVYYELNRAYAGLLRIRRRRTSAPQRHAAERRQLQMIERGLRQRDALEDHYAPFGIHAEPRTDEGFTREIVLHLGAAAGQPGSESDRVEIFSANIPFPLPSDFDWNRLAQGVQRALSDGA